MELSIRQMSVCGLGSSGERSEVEIKMWQSAVRSPRMRKVCLVQNSEEPQDLRRHQQRTIRSSSPCGSRPRKKYFYEEKVIKEY